MKPTNSTYGMPLTEMLAGDLIGHNHNRYILMTQIDALGAMEQALKLLANATSYGVLLEFITDERERQEDVLIYYGDRKAKEKSNKVQLAENGDRSSAGFKLEKPGPRFAPWGPHIPAGARLLLTIAETEMLRISDRKITHAMCDTDSFVFVRPPEMSREDYANTCDELATLFQSINPYEPAYGVEQVMFNSEDANYDYKNKNTPKPVYALVTSTKRYAMANIVKPDGSDYQDVNEIYADWEHARPIIRKGTGHGLGHISAKGYNDEEIEKALRSGNNELTEYFQPHEAAKKNKRGEPDYGKLCKGRGNPRLFVDMWRLAFIQTIRNGGVSAAEISEQIDEILWDFPGLNQPQFKQMAIDTRASMKLTEHMPGQSFAQFMNVLPEPRFELTTDEGMSPIWDDIIKTSLYTEGGSDVDIDQMLVEGRIYRMDNHQPLILAPTAAAKLAKLDEREKYVNSDKFEADIRRELDGVNLGWRFDEALKHDGPVTIEDRIRESRERESKEISEARAQLTPYLDCPIRLTTVRDVLEDYFGNSEAKAISSPSRRPSGMLMERRKLCIFNHEYIGKETRPLTDKALPEDDVQQLEDVGSVPYLRLDLSRDLYDKIKADLFGFAEACKVSQKELLNAIQGRHSNTDQAKAIMSRLRSCFDHNERTGITTVDFSHVKEREPWEIRADRIAELFNMTFKKFERKTTKEYQKASRDFVYKKTDKEPVWCDPYDEFAEMIFEHTGKFDDFWRKWTLHLTQWNDKGACIKALFKLRDPNHCVEFARMYSTRSEKVIKALEIISGITKHKTKRKMERETRANDPEYVQKKNSAAAARKAARRAENAKALITYMMQEAMMIIIDKFGPPINDLAVAPNVPGNADLANMIKCAVYFLGALALVNAFQSHKNVQTELNRAMRMPAKDPSEAVARFRSVIEGRLKSDREKAAERKRRSRAAYEAAFQLSANERNPPLDR